MFLTKNRLKKPRKTIEDDEMLHYLKFSHFDDDEIIGKDLMHDKATQFPEMVNKSTQTKGKETSEKGVDTYDELNKIVGDYILQGNHKNINKNDKMVQVNTYKINSRSSSSSGDDGDGYISRNIERGFRLAQLSGSAMLTALNIADTVGSAVLNPVIDSALDYLMSNPPAEQNEDEEVEDATVPSGSDDASIDGSRSRDDSSGDNIGHGLLQRGASRSRSITPSTPASSAKTTPRKISK